MKKFISWKYWFNFSGRIGRLEFLFRWIGLCLFINVFILVTKYIDNDYRKYLYLPFMLLSWSIVISTVKTRYNDLPSSKKGIMFWLWRCFFTDSDGHNDHGAPAGNFSTVLVLYAFTLYIILYLLIDHLGIK